MIKREFYKVLLCHVGRFKITQNIFQCHVELLERVFRNIAVFFHPNLPGENKQPFSRPNFYLMGVIGDRFVDISGISKLHKSSLAFAAVS